MEVILEVIPGFQMIYNGLSGSLYAVTLKLQNGGSAIFMPTARYDYGGRPVFELVKAGLQDEWMRVE